MSKNTNIIDFLDSKGLYIGVIPDPDGETWLIEVCGIPIIGFAHSRAEAERIGISEAMKVLSNQYEHRERRRRIKI